MHIRYISDIHLEFWKSQSFVLPVTPNDQVLIVAGDLGLATKVNQIVDFFSVVASQFSDVIYVMGNHEYYNSSIDGGMDTIREHLSHLSNIHILENQKVEIGSYNFIGATLWSDFDNNNALTKTKARVGMNDFRIIRNSCQSDKKFTPDDALALHNQSKQYINDNCTKNTIVVTHNAPSFESVAPIYRDSDLNGAFASNLEDLIIKHQPLYWFHGHMHNSIDYTIGDTRVLCNPYGYNQYEENPDFDPNASIEL